jgi:hypothetical protein
MTTRLAPTCVAGKRWLSAAYRGWKAAGKPPAHTWRITITPEGHRTHGILVSMVDVSIFPRPSSVTSP